MSFYEKIFFNTYLESNEKLIYTIHRHWLKVLRSTLKVGLFGIFIPASLLLLFLQTPESKINIVLYVWMGLGFIASLYVFTDWYGDAWLLTDKSIIDVRWNGFFNRSAQRMGYESIESASYEIKGVKETIFNFGTVRINSESGNSLEIDYISNPKKAEHQLGEMIRKRDNKSGKENLDVLKELLGDVIHEEMNKRGKGR